MSDTYARDEDESRLDIDESTSGNRPEAIDEELDALKDRLGNIEEEHARLHQMEAEHHPQGDHPANAQRERREDVDSRSVFVGNVDYGASPEEIQNHFQSCGSINRVTILLDKHTGHPKGYAYVEFSEPSLVANALVLNDSEFRGRTLKVTAKRTNVPGMHRGGRGGRGPGGFGGRGGFGGGFGRGGRGGYGPPGGYGGGPRGGYGGPYRGGGRGRAPGGPRAGGYGQPY